MLMERGGGNGGLGKRRDASPGSGFDCLSSLIIAFLLYFVVDEPLSCSPCFS